MLAEYYSMQSRIIYYQVKIQLGSRLMNRIMLNGNGGYWVLDAD